VVVAESILIVLGVGAVREAGGPTVGVLGVPAWGPGAAKCNKKQQKMSAVHVVHAAVPHAALQQCRMQQCMPAAPLQNELHQLAR
jgi:hypothetical protein